MMAPPPDSPSNYLSLILTPVVTAEVGVTTLFCLFGLVSIASFNQVWKAVKPTNQSNVTFTGEKTRLLFMLSLFSATLARSISLALLFLSDDTFAFDSPSFANSSSYGPSSGDLLNPPPTPFDSQKPFLDIPGFKHDYLGYWLVTLCQTFPSLLFLSTYSIVILFWAQVYYTARFVSSPYLRPSFLFANAAVYLVFSVISFLTFILKAYLEYKVYVSLVSGSLYLFTAVAFAFFGFKVAFQFSGDSFDREHLSRKTAIIRRVLSMSLCCPLLLAVRGVYDLSFAFQISPFGSSKSQLPITWSCLVIFLSEWLPVTLMLIAFWPSNAQSARKMGNGSNAHMTVPLLTSNYHVQQFRDLPSTLSAQSWLPNLDNNNNQRITVGLQNAIGEFTDADSRVPNIIAKFVPNHFYPVGEPGAINAPISTPNNPIIKK